MDSSILEQFYNALRTSDAHCNNKALLDFKERYPSEYQLINSCYHKRSTIVKNIKAMQTLGKVYFCTLTFGDERNEVDDKLKLKQAQRFLNGVFDFYLLVEEYGEKNGRYHIHLFGLFKPGMTFKDFFQWDYRTDIKEVYEGSKRYVNYVANYTVKALPKIRRNKKLIELCRLFQKKKTLNNYGFSYYDDDYTKDAHALQTPASSEPTTSSTAFAKVSPAAARSFEGVEGETPQGCQGLGKQSINDFSRSKNETIAQRQSECEGITKLFEGLKTSKEKAQKGGISNSYPKGKLEEGQSQALKP